MKKLIAIVVSLMLLVSVCGAEVVYGGTDAAVAAAAQKLAEAMNTTTVQYGTEMDAANAALANESYVCVATQQIMLEGLQGYSDEDLRTEFFVCGILAEREYCLMGTPEAAELCADASAMGEYLDANNYALIMARTMEASNMDYVSCEMCNEYYFDQELFYDDEEVMDMIPGGAYVYVVNVKDAEAKAEAGLSVFGATKDIVDLEGDQIFVFTAAADKAQEINAQVNAIAADEALVTALGENGYTVTDPDLETAKAYTARLFVDYVDYMTAEGLMFYEE